MKKNLLLTALALTLIASCSTLFSNTKRNYKQHYIVKKFRKSKPKLAHKQYENQDGYFGGLFDEKGDYVGFYKIGSPYKVKGISYIPQKYKTYKETGVASWYGGFFNGRETANGEIYDSKEITAAHPTLPLPSIVRVTNLENGKMIMARVNDRGPFADDRIIDLSEQSAKLLGFRQQGITNVTVELLPDETDELLKQLNLKE